MAAKILVVDDTVHNVRMLVDLLTAKGYSTVTAVVATPLKLNERYA